MLLYHTSTFWSVCPVSICPLVCYEVILRLFVANSNVFKNVLVGSSDYLPDFSESADARDLGLMLFFSSEQFSMIGGTHYT